MATAARAAITRAKSAYSRNQRAGMDGARRENFVTLMGRMLFASSSMTRASRRQVASTPRAAWLARKYRASMHEWRQLGEKAFAREWLDDKAGGARGHAARDRFPACVTRQHDHGNVRMRRARLEPLGQSDSIHSRKIDVHEDGRRPEGPQPGKSARCIRRVCDIEALLLERLGDQLRREGIVLDDEHDRPLRLQLVGQRASVGHVR